MGRHGLRVAVAATVVGICAIAGAAGAQEADDRATPYITGGISIEVQDDWTVEADDPAAEINDLYATVEPSFALHLLPGLSLNTDLVLEPVRDPDPFEDRAFGDEGLYAETLYLLYEGEGFALWGGKIDPAFGVAWDLAPGVYGADLAEDYQLTERIGVGASATLGSEALGAHTLSASAFFLDTSVLSRSAFTDRGRTRRSSGGPSNTGDLGSFTMALDGGNRLDGADYEPAPGAPGVFYHLALSHQERGVDGVSDETGVAAAVYANAALTGDVLLQPIVEYAYQQDDEGGPDDVRYLTAGAALVWGPWNVAASGTWRGTELAGGGGDVNDSQLQISAGYAFEIGVTVDVGYKHLEEAGQDADVLGILFAYGYEF